MFLHPPGPYPDEHEDIEDYGFALDLDDLLAGPGSSPSRRISFTTSSERDTPFVRLPPVPVKPRARHKRMASRARSLPDGRATQGSGPKETTTTATVARPAKPRPHNLNLHLQPHTRTHSPAPQRHPTDLPVARTRAARIARTRTCSSRAASVEQAVATRAPSNTHSGSGANDDRAEHDVDADDALPPSSPIAPSPSASASPLSSPSRPSPDTATPSAARDPSLPPSSPIRAPRTPPPRNADAGSEAEAEMMELVASPPSPTLDALRITSRVAVRALLNPMPEPVFTPGPPTPGSEVVSAPTLPDPEAEAEAEAEPMEDVPVADWDEALSTSACILPEDTMEMEMEVDAEAGDGVCPLVLGLGEDEDGMVTDDVAAIAIALAEKIAVMTESRVAAEEVAGTRADTEAEVRRTQFHSHRIASSSSFSPG